MCIASDPTLAEILALPPQIRAAVLRAYNLRATHTGVVGVLRPRRSRQVAS